MASPIDPHVFRACAGPNVKIPLPGSLVYYFPHGHAEQSTSFIPLALPKPFCLCRVVSVSFLSNPDSDEVFARLRLRPVPDTAPPIPDADRDIGIGVVSYVKVLTPSDANNGGGFSVPRYCADKIFPPLNFNDDPPVQTLSTKDIHGKVWEFRHIYRGTPRRHLLTSGWTKFVNSKMIIAGDSLVFVKNENNEVIFGIRRTMRAWNPTGELPRVAENIPPGGFSRRVMGRLRAEDIMQAVRSVENGDEFEVEYYPRVEFPEFVVEKEVVERAMEINWVNGLKVKMQVETDDSKVTWHEGSVDSVGSHTPWRMLQVNFFIFASRNVV